MSDNIALSIVLPCYNEAGNLPELFKRFADVLGERRDVEVLFVNNGSTDDSAAVLAQLLDSDQSPHLRVVTVQVNRGYGFGIMSGIRASRGEVVCWTHADLQTDVGHPVQAYETFIAQPDYRNCYLKGKRSGRPAADRIFTWGMSHVVSSLLGQEMSDINAQPKMFYRDLFERIGDPPDNFFIEIYALYWVRRLGMRVIEYPVTFAERGSGQAKGGGRGLKGRLSLSWQTVRYAWQLRNEMRQEVLDGHRDPQN